VSDIPPLPPGYTIDTGLPPLPAGYSLEKKLTPKLSVTAPPLDDAGAGESFLRRASSAVSSNLINPLSAGIAHAISGQPYQQALQGINESDAQAQAAHPVASTLGAVAGTAAQVMAPLPVKPGILGGAAQGAAFGAAQGAGDTLTAGGDLGQAGASALKGAAVGGVVGGAIGGVASKIIRGAPSRIDSQILTDIGRGDAGGKAAKKLTDKLVQKAGEDGSELIPVLEQTGLKKVISLAGNHDPGAGAKATSSVISHISEKVLDPAYAAIDAGPAVPSAIGVKVAILDAAKALKSSGNAQAAAHVEKYANFLDHSYADGEQVTGSMIRSLRNEVGTAITAEEARTKPGQMAVRSIYGALNDTIEKAAAATPGVDVAALKEANRQVSILYPVRDALRARAAAAETGGSSASNAIKAGIGKVADIGALGAGAALGFAGHPSEGLATAVGGLALHHGAQMAMDAGARGYRALNYGAHTLQNAAQAGSLPAQAGRAFLEGVTSRATGPVVRSGLDRLGLFPGEDPNQ
jgi:hypothetical protein